MLEQLNPPCVRSVSGCFLFAASSPNRSNRNITSVSPAGLFNLPSSLAPLVFPTVSQLSSKVIQETGETHTHTHTNDSSWISLTSVLIGLCCWSCRDTKSTEVFPSSHWKFFNLVLHRESVSPHVTACLCFLLQLPDAGGDFWEWRQHEAGRTRSRFSFWVTRTSRLQSADCDNSPIFTNVKAENDDSLYHQVNIINWTNLTPVSIFHPAKILIK